MRTIKRKRLFGGNNRLHKKKHRKSLKKFRGGMEPNATSAENIWEVKGILGVFKSQPLYTFPKGEVEGIKNITTPTLFKGTITRTNNSVILSGYEALPSIKLGWIYGSHFGNIVIYSDVPDITLDIIKRKLTPLYLTKGGKINKTLFIPPITEKITKQINPSEKNVSRNQYTPWGNKMDGHEVNITKQDDIADDIDGTFINILKKYYYDKIDGISQEKITALIEIAIKKPENATEVNIAGYNASKEKIKAINNNFTQNQPLEIDGTDVGQLTWGEGADAMKDYKPINNLRLKQEVIYKEITDIFSEYNDITIPFNIEYFGDFEMAEGSPENYKAMISFFERLIGKVNGEAVGKFNHYCYQALHNIIYTLILMGFGEDVKIYRAVDFVRYKKFTKTDYDRYVPRASDDFTIMKTGYRDFMNGNYVNSLIDPIIMSKLLVFFVRIKATILLTCVCSEDGKLVSVDIEKNTDIHKLIDEDDNRLEIDKLEINGVPITSSDMKPAPNGTDAPASLKDFAKTLEDNKGKEKIKCTLNYKDPKGNEESLSITGDYNYIKHQGDTGGGGKKDIMIYLYDDKIDEALIEEIFSKVVFGESIYSTITGDKIEKFKNTLLDDSLQKFGHQYNYYNLVI